MQVLLDFRFLLLVASGFQDRGTGGYESASRFPLLCLQLPRIGCRSPCLWYRKLGLYAHGAIDFTATHHHLKHKTDCQRQTGLAYVTSSYRQQHFTISSDKSSSERDSRSRHPSIRLHLSRHSTYKPISSPLVRLPSTQTRSTGPGHAATDLAPNLLPHLPATRPRLPRFHHRPLLRHCRRSSPPFPRLSRCAKGLGSSYQAER